MEQMFELNKFAVGLIVVCLLVVVGTVLYVRFQPETYTFEPTPNLTTLRLTESGEVVGFLDVTDARAWLGIPFAKPPVGELRWMPPQPPDRSPNRLEAIEFSSSCVQFASVISGEPPAREGGIVGSEDCLYLNIWAPTNAVDLPVMLWLHGGGNSVGSGSTYNGSKLAARHNVVVITINYRLGILGWFHLPQLDSRNRNFSGNFGLLDIVRALEWTRDNVIEFGGDPNNVTLFGEAAGGANVLAIMASPLASALFHRAIVQSGGIRDSSTVQAMEYASDGGNQNSSRELIARWMVRDRLADDAPGARQLLDSSIGSQVADYVRGIAPAELLAEFETTDFGMTNFVQLIRDGIVVPDEGIGSAIEASNVPLLIGSNRDERALFMAADPEFVRTTLWIFRSFKDKVDYRKRVYYESLAWRIQGVNEVAERLLQAGNKNVYAYRFDWDEEPSLMFFDLSTALGAAHAMEIPFVFDTFESSPGTANFYPNDTNQRLLSDQMMSYWTNFAYEGTPGKGRRADNPEWLAWGTDGKTSIVLDTATDGGIRMIEDKVTWQELKQELVNDEDFTQLETKCELYMKTFLATELFDQQEYDEMGCSEHYPTSFGRAETSSEDAN